MTLFGTDGIRGRAGEGFLSPASTELLGRAMGEVLQAVSGRAGIAVARDTRESGESQQRALARGLQVAGSIVLDLGVLPTPALSWHVALSENLAGGVMVTASHNPWEDNGLKLFADDGSKVSDALQSVCEARYYELSAVANGTDSGTDGASSVDSTIGIHKRVQDAYLESLVAPGDLSDRCVVVDSASGAAWQTLPQAFRDAGAEVIDFAPSPDGRNINNGVGATQPAGLAAAVRENHAWAGVAVDGDGDRIVVVDEQGGIHDGDSILGVLAEQMKQMGTLRGNAVVGTVTTNSGLEQFLAGLHLNLIRTPVGDRNIATRMSDDGCNLGGESSGHILTPDLCPTGDGTRVALWLLGHAAQSDQALSALFSSIPRHPVANRQVDAGARPDLESLADLQALAADIETTLAAQGGSVLLRYSGTEPILRIRVEGPDGDLVEGCADRLAACATAALRS